MARVRYFKVHIHEDTDFIVYVICRVQKLHDRGHGRGHLQITPTRLALGLRIVLWGPESRPCPGDNRKTHFRFGG